jgi:hypothetical protein
MKAGLCAFSETVANVCGDVEFDCVRAVLSKRTLAPPASVLVAACPPRVRELCVTVPTTAAGKLTGAAALDGVGSVNGMLAGCATRDALRGNIATTLAVTKRARKNARDAHRARPRFISDLVSQHTRSVLWNLPGRVRGLVVRIATNARHGTVVAAAWSGYAASLPRTSAPKR